MLDDVLSHLHVAFQLISIQLYRHHFSANFPHVQIPRDNLPNTIFFISPWLVINWTVNQRLSHTTFPTHLTLKYPACWRPPAPGIIFYLPLMLLKNTFAWHGFYLFTLVILFQVLATEFSTTAPKYFGFIRCSIFIISFLVVVA